VIERWRAQRSFGDGLIAAEVADLHEVWMRQANRVLDDPQIVAPVYEALAQRRPKSRSRGRPGSPAEVVLRLLVLKHVRNWSYEVLEREVRANLVYRDFTRVGGGKVPDAKTMGRWGMALGPAPVAQIHDRIVHMAQAERVVQGRRMRIDTTVVETNIHYPTDSSLLGDGVRVLTRTMKKVASIAEGAGARLRDRTRSVQHHVLNIARAARAKSAPNPCQAERDLRQAARRYESRRRPSQVLCARNRRRRKAGERSSPTAAAGGLARRARSDATARCAGDAANTRSDLRRRHPRRRQDRQPLRAVDRGHPQRKGQQADRVRQDGQAAGSGEPSHHCL
jgi:hypothetical protein